MRRRKIKSKKDVLEVLKAKGSDMVEVKIKGYNRATIYRILNRFHEEGIVHRILGANGKQYFAVCTNCEKDSHNHHHIHFQCKNYEKVECLNEEPNLNLPQGYVMIDFNGLVSGLCSKCS